ncbi:MAG: GGDEF domain-containing protein, partial [Candidatus Thiodiazotropha sp.]
MKSIVTIGTKRSYLLAALLVAFVMLLFLFWGDESREYAEVSHTLLQLKEIDARLDRDVLRVTSFLLVQYDPLVQSSRRFRELRHTLENTAVHQDKRFHELVKIYWRGMDEKLAFLEKIKFQAALVRNGIHYLPIVSQGLSPIEPQAYQK